MVLDIDRSRARIAPDTGETPRPRSLELALARLGFATTPDRSPPPRWSRTWTRCERDDLVRDWRPL